MSEPKIYVPKSGAKEVTFKDGGSIIRLSFQAEALMEFIRKHKNQQGWININVSKRQVTSQYGDTHCLYLDTWKPKEKTTPQPASQPTLPIKHADSKDDVPF